jgi:hypothetical protein
MEGTRRKEGRQRDVGRAGYIWRVCVCVCMYVCVCARRRVMHGHMRDTDCWAARQSFIMYA